MPLTLVQLWARVPANNPEHPTPFLERGIGRIRIGNGFRFRLRVLGIMSKSETETDSETIAQDMPFSITFQ
jgi:hypothetical protein